MASFTVDGVQYELVSLDSLDDFTLGDLRILEKEGGLSISSLSSGDVAITTDLLLALVLLSMRRVNPDASIKDAEKVSITVLTALGETIAGSRDAESVPPTTAAEAAGHQQ